MATAPTPLLTLVGSKGKGTAAAYASAVLGATGRRVVTVTSPSFRTNRERIRLDGAAISAAEMAALSSRLSVAMSRLAPSETDGYLSPSGLFILAGMVFARSREADFVVLEAGRGGKSDEAALFAPTVAAITPIFEEHVGELGATVEEIAGNKAAIARPQTRAVLSAPQRPAVTRAVRAAVAESSGATVEFPELRDPDTGSLPAGLGTVNARLGCAAAWRLLEVTETAPPAAAALGAALTSMNLPGRLSWHRTGPTAILLDQAVTREGVATALALAEHRWGRVDRVLVSLSDDKDLRGVIAELAGRPVGFVRLDRPHLRFERQLPASWTPVAETDLTSEALSRLGRHVVAVGTASFVALLLELLDVPTERLYTPP